MKNKFLDFDRVLCLSPHPDDVEYSMSGTILKYPGTYFYIICLTVGGKFDNDFAQQRQNEVVTAWKETGADNYELHFFDDSFFIERGLFGWNSYLEQSFSFITECDCIIGPSEHDSHFEHGLTSKLMHSLSRVTAQSIIEYKSPSTLETWIPNLFIDIEDVYEIKNDMITEFITQLKAVYFNRTVFDSFHNNFQSNKKGKKIVESFKIIRYHG